ncbi:hypothetical protein [Amaricoccus sp. W119]|uniref:hypothetical protein n=1 Tax=Amaricoccus sp. W119 TaxID=3391833 RepID=UPI0039A470DD
MSPGAPRSGVWPRRALPPLLGLVAIHVALVPLAPGREAAAPDLLYCLLVACVVRAPAVAPALVVLALGLFADLMLSRPPGLGALGLLVVAALIRAPGGAGRDWSLLREWLVAATAFALMMLAMLLVLKLTLAEGPSFGGLRRHVLATAVAYPFVAALVGWLLRPAPARGSPTDAERRS